MALYENLAEEKFEMRYTCDAKERRLLRMFSKKHGDRTEQMLRLFFLRAQTVLQIGIDRLYSQQEALAQSVAN